VVSSGEREDEDSVGEKAKYESESPKTSRDEGRWDEDEEDEDEEVSSSVHSSPREMTAGGE